jgi:hypothetical protein
MEQVVEMRRENGFSGLTSSAAAEFRGEERRRKARISVPFPTTVRWKRRGGERFEVETELENISASGLYLRMDHHIEPGTKIFVIASFSTTSSQEIRAPRVGIRGIVRRVELEPSGTCGVAVAITSHRFL